MDNCEFYNSELIHIIIGCIIISITLYNVLYYKRE